MALDPSVTWDFFDARVQSVDHIATIIIFNTWWGSWSWQGSVHQDCKSGDSAWLQGGFTEAGVEEPVRGQVGPCCQRASLLWEEHQRRALKVVSGSVRPEEVGLLSHEPASHVRRLLLVRVRVLHHPVLADEALAAHVAGEGLLAGVQAHVAAQVRLVVELLGAHLALVRLVPGVLGHVLLKQNKRWKLSWHFIYGWWQWWREGLIDVLAKN